MSRVAVVTGGGSGLGAATSRRMAEGGFSVAVADIRVEAAYSVCAGLAGSGHTPVLVDVTGEASVEAMFAQVEERLGPVAVMALFAGGTVNTQSYRPRFIDTTLDDWVRTEALNARGTFLCLREYLRRRTVEPVEDGRVVTVSSAAAELGGGPTGVAYSAAKGAIISLTKSAALEAARLGITVNCIAPGAMDTPALHTVNSERTVDAIAHRAPAGRIGQPEDVAALVAFLLSKESGYITGATIDINGGLRMA